MEEEFDLTNVPTLTPDNAYSLYQDSINEED
jgi:hypothetical protein